MLDLCCMNWKSFFFFCNYKESFFKRLLTRIIRLFISNKTNPNELTTILIRYIILALLVLIASVVYVYFGDRLVSYWSHIRSWCISKYNESNKN